MWLVYRVSPASPTLSPVSKPSSNCCTTASKLFTTASKLRSRPERDDTSGVREPKREAITCQLFSKCMEWESRTQAQSANDVVQCTANFEQQVLNEAGKSSFSLATGKNSWRQLGDLSVGCVDGGSNVLNVGDEGCCCGSVLSGGRVGINAGRRLIWRLSIW